MSVPQLQAVLGDAVFWILCWGGRMRKVQNYHCKDRALKKI